MGWKYWSAEFNRYRWLEFLSDGCGTYGVAEDREPYAKKVHPGDRLVCYVTLPSSAFAGILEVLSDYYYDTRRIWRDDLYPIRFDVKPIVKLNISQFVQAVSLRKELYILKSISRNKQWWGFFRGSLAEFPYGDGEHIEDVLTGVAAESHRTA
jgi:predicted RNA-binding protein